MCVCACVYMYICMYGWVGLYDVCVCVCVCVWVGGSGRRTLRAGVSTNHRPASRTAVTAVPLSCTCPASGADATHPSVIHIEKERESEREIETRARGQQSTVYHWVSRPCAALSRPLQAHAPVVGHGPAILLGAIALPSSWRAARHASDPAPTCQPTRQCQYISRPIYVYDRQKRERHARNRACAVVVCTMA
jgi:hypothetical protein